MPYGQFNLKWNNFVENKEQGLNEEFVYIKKLQNLFVNRYGVRLKNIVTDIRFSDHSIPIIFLHRVPVWEYQNLNLFRYDNK
jgi:hypothetical protein